MKTLLVALDDSPRAGGVLTVAADLARRLDAKLVLFRAVGVPIGLPPEAFALSPVDLPGLLEKAAQRDLHEKAAALPALTTEVLVRIGTPWDAICSAAKDLAVDMIVIGSHGFSGLDRILGTTAARVVNHAPCSVLVHRNHS